MSAVSLATLLKIKIPGTAELLYQNYQVDPYVFNAQAYQYVGFEIQTYSQADLSLGSEDVKIAIRNTSFLRSLMRQYNDLKKATIQIFHVQPGVDVPPIGMKLLVSYATTEGSLVLFTLRAPTNALEGRLCSKFIEAADFPELPFYKPQL